MAECPCPKLEAHRICAIHGGVCQWTDEQRIYCWRYQEMRAEGAETHLAHHHEEKRTMDMDLTQIKLSLFDIAAQTAEASTRQQLEGVVAALLAAQLRFIKDEEVTRG